MKKNLVAVIMLLTMISAFVLNYGKSTKYIAKGDGEIEWLAYSQERLI